MNACILVSMRDNMFRRGLITLLKEAGYEIQFLEDISKNAGKHKNADYSIIAKNDSAPIVDQVINILGKFETGKIIVIVETIKSSEFNQLKSLGIKALLSTDIEPEEFVKAFTLLSNHEIINRGTIIPDGLFVNLSEREWQVCSFIAGGITVKEIARIIGIEVKTVEAHKFNLMKKLDIHNKIQLAIWFEENKDSWVK